MELGKTKLLPDFGIYSRPTSYLSFININLKTTSKRNNKLVNNKSRYFTISPTKITRSPLSLEPLFQYKGNNKVNSRKQQNLQARNIYTVSSPPNRTPYQDLQHRKQYSTHCRGQTYQVGNFRRNKRSVKIPKLGLQYIPSNSVPKLLRVNREAREEGLKVHKPYFEGGRMNEPRNTIYVHLPLDTLLIAMPKASCKVARHEFRGKTFSLREITGIRYEEGPWTGGSCWDRLHEPDSSKLVVGSVAELQRLSTEPYFMTTEGSRRMYIWAFKRELGIDSWEEKCTISLLEWKANCWMSDWMKSLNMDSIHSGAWGEA